MTRDGWDNELPDGGYTPPEVPPRNDIPSGSYNKVATAPDGVPVYKNGSRYFTRNADGSFTEQFQGGQPDWLKQQEAPPPVVPPPAVPPPPGGGGGGAPTGSIGAMDPAAVFQPPPAPTGMPSWMPAAPAAPAPLTLPEFGKAPAYVEPDYEAAIKDPGFQSELNLGRQQMEQSAAARGVLNGSGTLKDITAWGQNLGAQRVNDVKDRSVNNYLLNYQTQYVDPYKYAYQAALDKFTGATNIWQGQNSQWQTSAQVAQRNAEDVWQQAYTPFNDLWNRRITVGLS